MTKAKVVRYIIFAIIILLALASVALYLWEVIAKNVPPTKNLFRMLAVLFGCIAAFVRMLNPRRGGSIAFYEKQFAEQIRDAFKDRPALRKKLVYAIKLYNEDKLENAMKQLGSLREHCSTDDDFYAVWLFAALTFTECGLKEDAVQVYMELIDKNLATTTVYGNLGSLHSALGNFNDAITYSRLSIQNDPKNPAPHNNLAKLYFDNHDFENAKKYAFEALEIDHKFRQSATLLAVIYTLEGDRENAEKYSHIAISAGEHPERLKSAIEYYKSTMSEKAKEENI